MAYSDMLEPQTHLDHVRWLGPHIAEAAEGHLDVDVPSCPGNTVASMLLHTGGFCLFVSQALAQGRDPEIDWTLLGTEPLAAHRDNHARLVGELASREPGLSTWSWGSDQRVRFWYRRAAAELSVHCWDVENAAGATTTIPPAIAGDAIEEFLTEFGPHNAHWDYPGAAEKFGGNGETFHLHATDSDGEWTITALPDRFEVERTHGKGDVAVRGTASDLLLFVWGRIPPNRLEIFGDTSLLDRWHQRVKI